MAQNNSTIRFTIRSEPAQRLFQLFDRFLTDPRQGVDAGNDDQNYIRDYVYPKDPSFSQVTLKNFYLGYRRFANRWNQQREVAGQRRGKPFVLFEFDR